MVIWEWEMFCFFDEYFQMWGNTNSTSAGKHQSDEVRWFHYFSWSIQLDGHSKPFIYYCVRLRLLNTTNKSYFVWITCYKQQKWPSMLGKCFSITGKGALHSIQIFNALNKLHCYTFGNGNIMETHSNPLRIFCNTSLAIVVSIVPKIWIDSRRIKFLVDKIHFSLNGINCKVSRRFEWLCAVNRLI